MNQVRKIGTLRLSAGFFLCFAFLNNNYGNISNIYSDPLEFTCKENYFTQQIFERHLDPLPTPPKLRLWVSVNYPLFLPDLEET